MPRVLIFEPSYRRIEPRLAPLAGRFELLLMNAHGEISWDGQPLSRDEAQPEVAWTNTDVFGSAHSREFFIALLKSKVLTWLQSGGAGFEHPMFAGLIERGVRLTNSHAQAEAIAEFVLAGVLDHYQRGPARRAAQAAADWRRIHFREIFGTHWLIIGFGAIGQATAARARAFGARTTSVRRSPGGHPHADAIVGPDQALALAPDADVVVLSPPLTDETRNFVDARFLAAMKPGSVLVNAGRGALVDEAALLAALDRGAPEHALLDVFATEPLPADSRFWTHPRVAVTAHTSGFTDGQQRRNDELFVDNLGRYLRGEALRNEVSG